MAGPWEQYANTAAPAAPPAADAGAAPWLQYQAPAEERGSDGALIVRMADQDAGAVAPQPAQAPPTAGQRVQASIPGRMVQGLRDPLDALTQMSMRAIPDSVISGVNAAAQYVNDLPVIGPATRALGMVPASQQGVDEMIRGNEAQYQASRAATGNEGFDFARLGGNMVSTAPLAAAGTAAQGANFLTRLATGTAAGTGFGGLQPVLQGQFTEEKLKQMGMGTATGGAGTVIGNALSRLVSPRASVNPQVQTLLDEGVTPTPGQILGGVAGRTEDKLTSVPGLGDVIVNARRRGVEEFNQAALNRAASPIGATVSSTGREGLSQVQNAIGEAYDEIVPRLIFRADDTFNQDLNRIQQMGNVLPPPQAAQLNTIIQDKVVGKLTPQGVATGPNYREIEMELGRLANDYRSAVDVDQRQLGAALTELQNSLRQNLTRSNPQASEELGKINTAYSNLVRLQRAAGGVGAENGVFTPAQLASAVRASDGSMRKNAYGRGEALMQDLSDAGKTVMSSKIPDSGTAGRAMMGVVTGGAAGMLAPNLLIGAGAAAIPYLAGPNRLAALALARRPEAAVGIANQVRRIGPTVGVLAGPAAYQGTRD